MLELVRKTDPQWVSGWLVDRIIDGTLSGSHWVVFISSFSEGQRRRLDDEIGGRELSPIEMHRIADLAAVADGNLCGSLFSRACVIRSDLSAAPLQNDERSSLNAILRQLEEFLRAASPRVAVASIVARLSAELIPHEYRVVIDTFGSVGDEEFDLSVLEDDMRQRLRAYVTAGMPYVLTQDDYTGDLKARAATALARMGEPEDIALLRRTYSSRHQSQEGGSSCPIRGDRRPMGNGAVMSYSNWHVRAVLGLRPEPAELLLIELLREPEMSRTLPGGCCN